MNEEELGFDPTVTTDENTRYIEIERNGSNERLIIDEVMLRTSCMAGRATTCWKAHREEDPQTPLVIKDSWQYLERDEEGELLREASNSNVINVARYCHHETVHVDGTSDDVENNVRKSLDVAAATNFRLKRSIPPPLPSSNVSASETSRRDHSSSNSAAGKKRSSSRIDAPLPLSKRNPCGPSTGYSAGLRQAHPQRKLLV